MTLFFPSSTSNVKINASNSQVGVTVGDTMSITAGDSFTIAGGSTSSIKIGPATSFSIGSAVNVNLASTLSYTYGFTASYGSAATAMSTSSKAKATDSYTIQAGVYTPVTQKLIWTEKYQVWGVLLATILSMGAIAIAVVGGLSSPMFIADPSGGPNAVKNDSGDVARAACAMAITTVTVFIGQWALTYLLAQSSEFSPVTSMLFNSSGITATANTEAAYNQNAAINAANKITEAANVLLVAQNQPAQALISVVPSVESIMFASQGGVDTPMLTQRVNKAPINNLSPQLSEVILTTDTINLNTTTKPLGGAATVNTQIVMNATTPLISLLSNSVPGSNSGSVTIGAATNITNPSGNTTITSGTGTTSSLTLEQSTSATLASGNGSIVVKSTEVNVGVAGGGNAVFNAAGVTLGGATVDIAGTNITIGGALTILGTASPLNAALAAVPQKALDNLTIQQKLTADLALANSKLEILEQVAKAAQTAAEFATDLGRSLEAKMSSITPTKV